MKTQDLIDVAAICKAGSFRKAAIELGISQPTLSHRIAYLEQSLGVTLFERAHGSSKPTDIALFIANGADGIISQSDGLIRETLRVARGDVGILKLGFGPAPAHAFLADMLRRARSAMPDLSLEIFTGATNQLSDMLERGHIDLAVCPMDPELFSFPVNVEPLIEEPVVIAGRPDHPVFATPPRQPTDFFRHQVALPSLEPRYRSMSLELYGVDFGQNQKVIFCSNYDVLIRLVLSGEYLTAGPRFAFHRELRQGALATLPLDERVVHQLYLVSRKVERRLPALDSVMTHVRAAAAAAVSANEGRESPS